MFSVSGAQVRRFLLRIPHQSASASASAANRLTSTADDLAFSSAAASSPCIHHATSSPYTTLTHVRRVVAALPSVSTSSVSRFHTAQFHARNRNTAVQHPSSTSTAATINDSTSATNTTASDTLDTPAEEEDDVESGSGGYSVPHPLQAYRDRFGLTDADERWFEERERSQRQFESWQEREASKERSIKRFLYGQDVNELTNLYGNKSPSIHETAAICEETPLKPLEAKPLKVTVVMAPGDSKPRVPIPTLRTATDAVEEESKPKSKKRMTKKEKENLAAESTPPITTSSVLSILDSSPWPNLGAVPTLAKDLQPPLAIQGVVRIGEDLKMIRNEAMGDNGALIGKGEEKQVVETLTSLGTESTALTSTTSSAASSSSSTSSPSTFASSFESITHPHFVDLSSTAGFVTSSRDPLLLRLARTYQCGLMGSTSSTTKILTHFIFSLGNFHPIQTDDILSEEFNTLPKRATSAERAPAIVWFRKRKEGVEEMNDTESEEEYLRVKATQSPLLTHIPYVWAVDTEPSNTNPTNKILMELGHTLEAYFTHEPSVWNERFISNYLSLTQQRGKLDSIRQQKAWKTYAREMKMVDWAKWGVLEKKLEESKPTQAMTPTISSASQKQLPTNDVESETDFLTGFKQHLLDEQTSEDAVAPSTIPSSTGAVSGSASQSAPSSSSIKNEINSSPTAPGPPSHDTSAATPDNTTIPAIASHTASKAGVTARPHSSAATTSSSFTLSSSSPTSVTVAASSTTSNPRKSTNTPAAATKNSKRTSTATSSPSITTSITTSPTIDPVQLKITPMKDRESFLFVKMGNIMFRSQLDCWAPELEKRKELQAVVKGDGGDDVATLPSWPGWEHGGLVFDLKTRAVLPIRLFCRRYSEFFDYNLLYSHGLMYSFEREYYDMQRAAFLKYSLQCRLGRMGGVYIGYHNTCKLYGYQYVSVKEMDETLFGHQMVGEWMFQKSTALMERFFSVGGASTASDNSGEDSLLTRLESIHTSNWQRRHVYTARSAREAQIRSELVAWKAQVLDVFDKEVKNVLKKGKKEVQELQQEVKEINREPLSLFPPTETTAAAGTPEHPLPVKTSPLTPAEETALIDSSPPPSLQSIKFTVSTNESRSDYITVFAEMLPFLEDPTNPEVNENDPQADLPFLQRYTTQRRVDTLPNYKIREYLRELGLPSDGTRVQIVSRLESGLAIKPLQELPKLSVFLSLAQRNLLHKFVIRLEMHEKLEDGVTKGEVVHQDDIQSVIKMYVKNAKERDAKAYEQQTGVEFSVDSDRSAGARGPPLSHASILDTLDNHLGVSASVTHFSVENGKLSAEQLAAEYRKTLVSARLNDDSSQVDGQ